jgi:BsuBI/PstI restriction endonuclease
MTFRPVLPRAECEQRLRLIFPRLAFDHAHANPLGGAAIATMLYVDAVVPDEGPTDDAVWVRPSTCLWMQDDVLVHDEPQERVAWRTAALRTKKHLVELLESWGLEHHPWYADTTREPLRDETFPAWLEHGATRDRPGEAKNSPRPIWALTARFADLFNPALVGDALVNETEAWRESHMKPGALMRIQALQERERKAHAVLINLPDGQTRSLEPGEASRILKGVLESWAPVRLFDPVVLSISQPGDKVYVGDVATLTRLGITINASELLPDAVIVDIGSSPPQFWIVEAVASDGPITEDRRNQLIRWAEDHHIPREECRFLSAFISRHNHAARRRLKDLAVDTYAWYADEPACELAWYDIGDLNPE